MAVLTIYNTPVFAGGMGFVTYAAADQITITVGAVQQNYYGAFTYDGASVSGGVVVATNLWDPGNGGWQYGLVGLNHDAVTVAYYVNSGDTYGLQAFLFNGNDTLYGSDGGSDILIGYGGANLVYGYGGNDTIYGGLDIYSDLLIGGTGNDFYELTNSVSVVVESAGEGMDTIRAHVSGVTLPDNVETLLLEAAARIGIGNSSSNLLVGNMADNLLQGMGGNDTLQGGYGLDTLEGGSGNDRYEVIDSVDVIVELPDGGIDVVISPGSYQLQDELENLVLTGMLDVNGQGNSLGNILSGNAGSNLLNGLTGPDIMAGGPGDDIYVVDNANDLVMELGNSGIDAIQAGTSYSLMQAWHVENLTLTGNSAINGSGNWLNNLIIGNSAANVLEGGVGNDTLDGGAGSDRLIGGVGNDVYLIDSDDVLVEVANGGTDSVHTSASFVLGTEIENLTLTGVAAINGTGNALANVIIGNGAANILDGGAGADTLSGGLGDDTFHVDDAGDVVIDAGGVDTLVLTSSYSLENAPFIENVILGGSADINATGNSLINIITGNSGDNVLTAVGGGDRLFGMGGMDTLIGSGSGETIDGGGGVDYMVGGFGFDTYYVDDSADIVVEVLVNNSDYLDRVFSSVNYVLPEYLEILVLTGDNAINGSGKGSITGNNAGNYLTGSAFNDELYGMGGNDTLDGGAGSDIMFGGVGDDLYFIDSFTEAVHPVFLGELGGEGNDTIASAVDNLTLPANFEVLLMLPGTYWGTGNSLNNLIVGHASASVLDGGAGSDTMIGCAGDDEYRVDNVADVVVELVDGGYDKVQSSVGFSLAGTQVEELWLSLGDNIAALDGAGNDLSNYLRGNGGHNVLTGGGGNDTLDGWYGGVDTLVGGAGDDYFIVRDGDDVVLDTLNEGTDTVFTYATFTIEFLPYVENLHGYYAALLNLTGNDLNNLVVGSDDRNLLDGKGGNDTIFGYFGDDTLYGGGGDDLLDGGAGDDSIFGGAGDDYYVLGDWLDLAVENPSEGDDTISGSQYDLSLIDMPNIEHLILTDSSSRSGTGNDDNNTLIGNLGDNSLDGGLGNDTLDGGAGIDTLIGGQGDDVLVMDIADGSVQGGAGSDTLVINGSEIALDLTTIVGTLITDIEVIDISGSGSNSLTLALADVLAISSSTDILTIDGNAGDLVQLQGAWTNTGGSGYTAYVQGSGTVLIDTDITVAFI